jgi:hypothetical protein
MTKAKRVEGMGQVVECMLSSSTAKCKRKKKSNLGTHVQWLTPVILATQEAEIRRITV